jgi:hypothetical protein
VQRPGVAAEVNEFIIDRLRGLLLERADGTTAEMIDAVLAAGPRSPLDVETRLQALKVFLLLPDAAVLTAINKRIVNILRKTPTDTQLNTAGLSAVGLRVDRGGGDRVVSGALRHARRGAARHCRATLRGRADGSHRDCARRWTSSSNASW